ncbi:c-type cytochrome [Rhizobium sp. S95]|uniref:C-type cytochrome n=1 Tax=Ciceribacter sichuanensis TaxID=2949647 RepID=A0AAJ1BZM0_9HYPH|nr:MULTISPECIES: cytochrome c [unclassified Ciceribacter]MCM2397286.1 c-type cytochrome [Ciceribacter sp. S95]MCO5959064.1 c-type cytochrome [Ciceribacter sp. S101]
MLKSVLSVIVTFAIVVLIGFGIYAYHSPIAAMSADERPKFDAATIEKGRVLAAAGYCSTCHTAQGGEPYAGNYPIETEFGTIYASNITPDPETGIGTWSPEAFRRAMHDGVNRQGSHLLPAFPFDHFTKMTDEDVDAIYAYIMTNIAPVKEETKESSIPFPLNQRILQAGWKLLFVNFGRYEPDPSKSDQWNRGAYLAEGVSHCGACHTPRNAVGAEMKTAEYAGASIDKWIAPALTAANPSAVPWSAAEFTQYLETGSGTYHGIAAGPMGPVVHAGLRELPKSDLEAIGAYLGDVVGAPDSDPAQNPIVQASLEAGRPDPTYRKDLGERLYATACASCHYNAASVIEGRPDLAINSATRLGDPTNLIHVILDGVNAVNGTKGVVMPAFRNALSDEEIAAIAGYLRDKRTDLAPWPDLARKVADIRADAVTN